MSKLIQCLKGVRKVSTDQWTARCPAHEDREPSLSVKELSDGRILIHCHAGCGAADVMEAAGLSLRDLYPDGAAGEFKAHWWMRREKDKDTLERTVLELAESDRRKGKKLSMKDRERELEAYVKLMKHKLR